MFIYQPTHLLLIHISICLSIVCPTINLFVHWSIHSSSRPSIDAFYQYQLSSRLHVHMIWLSKESACNVGNLGSIPGLGKYPREGSGNALWCSCLKNSMDRGA